MNTQEIVEIAHMLQADAVSNTKEALKFIERGELTNGSSCLQLAQCRLKVAQANLVSAIREIKDSLDEKEATGNLYQEEIDRAAKEEKAGRKKTAKAQKGIG